MDQYNTSHCLDLTAHTALTAIEHEHAVLIVKTPAVDARFKFMHFFPCNYTDGKFFCWLVENYCEPKDKKFILNWLLEHQDYVTGYRLTTLQKNIALFKSITKIHITGGN